MGAQFTIHPCEHEATRVDKARPRISQRFFLAGGFFFFFSPLLFVWSRWMVLVAHLKTGREQIWARLGCREVSEPIPFDSIACSRKYRTSKYPAGFFSLFPLFSPSAPSSPLFFFLFSLFGYQADCIFAIRTRYGHLAPFHFREFHGITDLSSTAYSSMGNKWRAREIFMEGKKCNFRAGEKLLRSSGQELKQIWYPGFNPLTIRKDDFVVSWRTLSLSLSLCLSPLCMLFPVELAFSREFTSIRAAFG